MKKVAILGAGISGLFVANLFKENLDYQVVIYEKNNSIELDEGYGIQLSTNSIKLLNKIGFNTLDDNERFNPEKIDFYEIKKEKKICDLNLSEFNSENCKYTTLKRSKLIKFLKDRLDDNIIKYDHNIEKIESNNNQISLTFNKNNRAICDCLIISDGVFSKGKSLISNDEIKPAYNNSIAIRGNISRNNINNLNEKNNDQINLIFNKKNRVICDYLIISDGVFSKGKSLISNNKIKPAYNNSIAIRGNISKNNLNHLNKKNISLFMGHDFHYVTYPVNNDNEPCNFIGVLKYKLTTNELNNYDLFKEETFVRAIKDKLKNKISTIILDNIDNFKCFPVFVSKGYLKPGKNIFLVGDAFFAFPPSFAQGASQSIEGASELFDNIVNKKSNFYDNRVKKVKMINNRSKLNQFAFHLSNPILIFLRNISLKLLTKNKKFLENYLGKIYKN